MENIASSGLFNAERDLNNTFKLGMSGLVWQSLLQKQAILEKTSAPQILFPFVQWYALIDFPME
jgi:hypothetical protein